MLHVNNKAQTGIRIHTVRLSAFFIHSPRNYNSYFCSWAVWFEYSRTCVKRLLSKRHKIGLQDQLLLNAGQKYFRMLQSEHSAILSSFIKPLFVIKTFVLSVIEWPFYTGFTVLHYHKHQSSFSGDEVHVFLLLFFFISFYFF